jgi:hypothetical protein
MGERTIFISPPMSLVNTNQEIFLAKPFRHSLLNPASFCEKGSKKITAPRFPLIGIITTNKIRL